MIYHINGKVDAIIDGGIIIETNGVGYHIFMPDSPTAPIQGETIKIFTYHHIREDQQSLFGFKDLNTKQLFMALISVSGVGPKVALKMISQTSPEELSNAILSEDLNSLVSLPGVGKKMAERLIIELKDKVGNWFHTDIESKAKSSFNEKIPFKDDLLLALKSLGYHSEEIKKAIKKASSELVSSSSIEHGIKISLKYL